MNDEELPLAEVRIESEMSWEERSDPTVITMAWRDGWEVVEEEDEATMVFTV